MRRYEIEYRLTRSSDAEQHFLDEVKTLQPSVRLGRRRAVVEAEAQATGPDYRFTFAQWVASTDNIEPLLILIRHDTESVLPEADKIIASRAGQAPAPPRGARRLAGAHPQFHHLGGLCGWR